MAEPLHLQPDPGPETEQIRLGDQTLELDRESAQTVRTAFEALAAQYGAALEDYRRWGFPWNVVQGDVGDLKRGPYVFLDQSANKRFGAFNVNDYREFRGHRLKIIGTSKDARSFTTTPIAFVDFKLAQQLSADLTNRTSC